MEMRPQPHLNRTYKVELSELYELRGLIVNNLDRMENMTFDEHIQMLISHGDVAHTVDRGWLNTASDVLDIVGIVSAIGWIILEYLQRV